MSSLSVLHSIRCILDVISFNLINWFYEIWDLFVFGFVVFMRCLDLWTAVTILYKKVLPISSNSTFMLSPGAGMHTKRSASTSWYERKESNLFLFEKKMSYRQNRFKTCSFGLVGKPHMCSFITIKWNISASRGNPRPAAGGTRPGAGGPLTSKKL